ncbi:CLUMA_CG004559, isoform A [Clunio marinus]|uniref:Protein Wnt n=1 Tax=Clunio marinus TaxID=568069 RepID=A0A1J1HS74_9DIPT|nr:CLUMA_CG004559, isoform A [Clunio marinus]
MPFQPLKHSLRRTPEMAFIHALAAATTASFIARACRDGQLASCGCSRSARPNQLHEDWTWGGCGDDLEFGYKFSQNFIDIREKERKRGARGLVTVPTKNEAMGNETSADNATTVSTTLNPEEQAKADDMLKLQQKITQELLNSNLKENERNELQEKINKEILNSKLFVSNAEENVGRKKGGRYKQSSVKARSLMNLHNNEAGRRAVIKKHRIICKCHGVSGSCSLVTCWQQLSTIREIGDFLREQYEQATQVKMNKRGRLQVKDPRYKVPTAVDLVYLDESPDWCRVNKQLQWPGNC